MTVTRNIYNLHSRIHPLKIFGPGFYLKRDDELSATVSGSKLRKYSTLIPYLLENGASEVAIIGSTQSNNILGLCSMLIENEITPHLFLLEHHDKTVQGNFALTSLFQPKITWVPRLNWKNVLQIASQTHKWVVPEGADHPASKAGSATLVDDILRNQIEWNLTFDHLFLDAGTGSTARAVISRIGELGLKIDVHVVSMSKQIDPIDAHVHYSPIAPSFGSINRSVISWMKRLAQSDGVLTDPIYSAKLFATIDALQKKSPLEGNTLIVHSGLSPSLSWTVSRELGQRACANSKDHSRNLTAHLSQSSD